jgi:molecular chaperone DnaK
MESVGFGIDFGTTNSVVSAYDGRKITSFTDNQGLPHPSVLWFQNGDTSRPVVGAAAKMGISDYELVAGHKFIRSIKSQIAEEQKNEIFGNDYCNWEIASRIFSFLKDDIQNRFTAFPQLSAAVITVPLYFGGQQRRAIRKAAEAAGIGVKAFIHEPFAAAIGYLHKQYELEQLKAVKENILVFDWGGGTLDITLASVADGRIKEISNAGFPGHSGDYFDEALANYMVSKFIEENEIPGDIFQMRLNIAGSFQKEIESAKIRLSSDLETTIEFFDFFEFSGESLDLYHSVERKDFERLISPEIEQALNHVRRILDISKIDVSQVGKVLLVGGTSRLPLLREHMYKMFGTAKVISLDNSDTLISEGAAIISHHNWQPFLVNSLNVKLSDDSAIPIFESGAILRPDYTKESKTFICVDNRHGKAHVILLEDLGNARFNTKKTFEVFISKDLPNIYKERIHINFSIDEDLIFNIHARSSIAGDLRSEQIHDICYGLRFA